MMNAGRAGLGAVVVAVALSACGTGGPGQSAGGCPQTVTPAGGGPVAVTMWAQPEDRPQIRTLADRFNATHPAIKVSVDASPGLSWVTAIRDHETLPDLVELNVNLTQFAIDSGNVLPVQDCIDAAHYPLGDYLPYDLAASQVSGRQWALPLGYPPTLLIYSKTAFAKAGLDPAKPPGTLDQLLSDGQALQSSGIATPISAYDFDFGWELELSSVPLVDAGNGHAGRPGHAVFDTPLAARVANAVAPIFRSNLIAPPPSFLHPPSGPVAPDLEQIASGQAAMAIDQGWILPGVETLNAQGANIAVAPIPTVTGPVAWAPPVSLFMSVGSSPARRAATWEFLRWLEEPAQQAEEFFPTRRSAVPAQSFNRQAWNVVLDNPAPAPMPITAAYDPMLRVLDQMFQDATSGPSVADAVSHAQAMTDQLLADYNADPVGFSALHLGG